MVKIYIDPGHGGHDPGAIGRKSKEKDNVLKVAKRLRTLLEQQGHTVKLSRTKDVYLTLSQRANDANEWGADIFISLHNNAASASATGFETFIYNGGVSQKTKQLQNSIHAAIIKEIGIRNRGKKQANFAVLRQTKMPAILIEYAFITNNNDENILINEVNKLARITANGVKDFVGGKGKTPKKSSSKPKTKVKSTTTKAKSKTKVNLTVDGKWGKSTTRALQRALGTTVDGIISRQPYNNVTTALYGGTIMFGTGKGSPMVRALQRKVGAKVDGKLGSETVRKLQAHLGTVRDGKLSRPSLVVKEMQRRLNAGTF